MARCRRHLPISGDIAGAGRRMTSTARGRVVAMSNAGWTERDRRGDGGVASTAEFGRLIPFKTARLTLVSDADRTQARLGTVPLAFREWRGELEQRAPRFRRPAWVAAAAIHAVIGAAIILYASLTPLPEPPPVVAVTLSFEASKPTAEPGPTPTAETPPAEAAPTETSPTVPEPPADAAPEANTEIAAPAEPPQALPPPDPLSDETPPPPPDPPLAAAPETPKPVAVTVAPPPPPPRPATPPRRTARS